MKTKHDVDRGKACMKKFCESLRSHAIEMIKLEKKETDTIKIRDDESYSGQENGHIFKKKMKRKIC